MHRPTPLHMLGDDDMGRSREFDHLHPPMHPAAVQSRPTPGTCLDRVGHPLIHPFHSLPVVIVAPVPRGPRLRLRLALGSFTRPRLGLMLWWPSFSPQPLVLGLEGCHLLP